MTILPAVRDKLAAAGALARTRGISSEYIADLTFLDEQLHHFAKEWGDPMYDLDAAQLVVYRGLTDFLRVFYAVHLRESHVFVRNVELRHDRRLGRTRE